jgi:hypothetical protein
VIKGKGGADEMILDKKQMSEEDIKLQFITPAITSKWTLDRVTMETKITDGQINLEERSSLNAEIDRVLAEITEKLGGAK